MATAKIETGNIKLEVSDDHAALAVGGVVELLKGCMKTPLLMVSVVSVDSAAAPLSSSLEGAIAVGPNADFTMTFGVPSRS